MSAQNTTDTSAIRKQLYSILQRDQITRTNSDSAVMMKSYDSLNLIFVEYLIKKYGWPGRSFVGTGGNQAVFLVIQHADIKVQDKYYSLMEKSVGAGESLPSELALLKDRILMRHKLKQIFGSQIWLNDKSGEWEIWPVADEKNLNHRRDSVGLQPMEEYARFFGIEYHSLNN